MKVIGLTGGTGSGKGAVSTILLQEDAFIIDADHIAHEVIRKGNLAYNEIVQFFGNSILDASGEIIRKCLGEIVFRDKEKLAFLNHCTHKYIGQEIAQQMEVAKMENLATCIVIDAPLLLEAGLERVCDEIWVVFASEEVRAHRVMVRDTITYETACARIANQKPWAEYERHAHHVIDNSKDIAWLRLQLLPLLQGL